MDEIDLTLSSPRPAKRPRLAAAPAADFVDLVEEEPGASTSGQVPAAEGRPSAGPEGAVPRRGSGAAGRHPLDSMLAGRPARQATRPALALPAGLRRQQRQRSPPSANLSDDAALAKQMQEEEDRRTAAALAAEARLQRRFGELEAEEAAAEAAEAAAATAAAGRVGWGRGFLGNWFGGGGSSRQRSASAAAAAAGGQSSQAAQVPPRPMSRGPRSQRSRRAPAAEAEFASAMVEGLQFHAYGGYGGGYGAGGGHRGWAGNLQALQEAMMGLSRGLPADLLFSGRDFTDADYERLLALDEGNKKRVAPRDRVQQLEIVRVPPAARSGAAAASAAAAAAAAGATAGSSGGGGSGSSSSPQLDTCAICLEDARPGDRFRVLGCRHAFHQKCIDRWLTQERNSCPICQRQVV